MEELIRHKMHEALDVEQPDSRLRSRVLISLPADEVRQRRIGTPPFQWAAGLVAALLAVAVVAGLLSSRGASSVPGPTATIKEGSATITEFPIPVDSKFVSNHSGVVTVGPDGNLFIGTGDYIIKVSQSGSFTKYAIPTPDNVVVGFGPVEGGITRYAAVFQCRDASMVGPAIRKRTPPMTYGGMCSTVTRMARYVPPQST